MTAGLPSIQIESLPEAFFIDLAVGVHSYIEICDNYDIDEQTALAIENDPVFIRRLRLANQVVEDDGTAFKARCRVAVTNNVDSVMNMMRDPDISASVQLDAFKTLVKYGGLEPAKDLDGASAGPALTLNIVAPDGSTFSPMVATAQPVQDIVDAEYTSVDSPVLEIEAPAGKFASKVFGAQ